MFVLLIIVLLIGLKIFISMGHSALVNSRKSTLRERAEDGHRGAARALKLGEDATRLLGSYQFLSILLNLTIGILVVIAAVPPLQDNLESLGLGAALANIVTYIILIPVTSILLMMVGERIPSGIVTGRTEAFAILFARPMGWFVRLTMPLVFAILHVSRVIARLFGGTGTLHYVTEEEIKTLVDAGSEEGVLEDEEKEMIYSIIRFGDTVAREVMVPRIDIVALDVQTTIDEALDVIIRAGHSRIPIYRESIDNIEGILYAKDLLSVWRRGEKPESLSSLIRKAHFVPESKKASELLIELQQRKTHLVFVVDEYGGTSGVVTIEDLIEEIVGEIRDEYDVNEEALYEEINEHEYIFNARIDLDDMNRLLDTSIPTEDSDTLGGYIYSKLGRVPVVGDEILDDGLSIRVMSVTGRRIRKVHVKRLVTDEEQAELPPQLPENVPTRLNGNGPSTSTQSVNHINH